MQTYNSYKGPGRMTYIKLEDPRIRIETDGFTQQHGDKVMRSLGYLPEWEFESLATKKQAEEKKKEGLARLADVRKRKQEEREARDKEIGYEKKPAITKASIIKECLLAGKKMEEIIKAVQEFEPTRTPQQVKMQVHATLIFFKKKGQEVKLA